MGPLFFTIDNRLRLKVIPETDVLLDGHPLLTYEYKIFADEGIEKNAGNYLGYLTFERPGSLFTYTADGDHHLTGEEVTELIEAISNIRDNPDLWKLN